MGSPTAPIDTLSGGEAARAHLARVLAQRAPILLLDEPTAALDLRHQHLVVGIARRHARAGGTAVVVLHDLNLAAAYADRILLLAQGGVLADGPGAAVLTPQLVAAAYEHPVEILCHPRQRWKVVVADRIDPPNDPPPTLPAPSHGHGSVGRAVRRANGGPWTCPSNLITAPTNWPWPPHSFGPSRRIGCSLRLPCGRLVMVAEHPAHEPQLSPESFARLLRLDRDGPTAAPGLRWLRAVTEVRLVGPGVCERAGLLWVPAPHGAQLAFATSLDVERTREVLERTGPADDAALEEVTVTLRVDPILDCVVVSTPARVATGRADAQEVEALVEEAMAAALASCMVEELIAGPAAARPGPPRLS